MIGDYFRGVLRCKKINRCAFAQRLGFDYSDNERMICAYLVKDDRLWRESEVLKWCELLGISENHPKYDELFERAGRKDISR